MAKLIPSNLMITDVSITNYHRSYGTKSISGIQLSRDSGIQWYKGNITLQAYGYSNIRLLNGFLSNLKGRLYSFTLPLKGAYVNPDIGSNPTFSSSHTAGSTTVNVNHTGSIVHMGSVFTVPNETKLFTLGDSIEGTGNFNINPALKIAHTSPEVLNFINPVMTAILNDNETTITHEGNGMLATATLSWTEQLT
jgi:hypothetical protein